MTNCVHLSLRGAIAIVELADTEARNTFSARLIAELRRVFETIAAEPRVRVVVVHGYGNYFCCGGSKDELLQLAAGVRTQGKEGMSLDSLAFFDLFLRCEVPVIAAMQGHAIGGGLALGCFADLIVMAEESMYGAVFMKYGFTPGMGSTYIIPRKLGAQLGTEMLFTARNYYGLELKQRGAPIEIVKRAQTINRALELAEELADKPRLSLSLLKSHLTQGILKELGPIIESECRMHRCTFGQSEIVERIGSLFGAA